MTKLSVNVNKLATLRNARGKNNPDVVKMALAIIQYGADGITVHPRPDERHIRVSDVYALAEAIDVEFNIEGYPDRRFLDLIKTVRPAQCTLVPDAPNVLTSNAGWSIKPQVSFLSDVVAELKAHHVRTSLFIDPFTCDSETAGLLKEIGTDRVELYTEAYANDFSTPNAETTLARYKHVAYELYALGIGLNAGHDLDCQNLRHFVSEIPIIEEVSIGHALICDALMLGMQETIARYLGCLK